MARGNSRAEHHLARWHGQAIRDGGTGGMTDSAGAFPPHHWELDIGHWELVRTPNAQLPMPNGRGSAARSSARDNRRLHLDKTGHTPPGGLAEGRDGIPIGQTGSSLPQNHPSPHLCSVSCYLQRRSRQQNEAKSRPRYGLMAKHTALP